MRRGGPLAVTSSPTIIGALTVLITTLAVFLAYNAGAGLPFVPTYPISVIVPDATSLVANNEVRIGGIRVGLVKAITPVRVEDGRTMAKLDLELNRDVEPLPVDSDVLIRNRSSLGLKYLEITPGDSDEGYEAGATIPPTSARPHPVELDQVLNTFNLRTRIAAQQNLKGFGDALAGRGPDLNEAIGVLAPLLRHAQPVVANLAAPQTNLAGFFRGLAATAAEVAPVAETLGQLSVGLDQTFAALASVAPFISDTISAAPATLAEGTRSLPAVRPFLEHSERFFRVFEPGAEALADTSPTIAAALHAGVPVLNESPRLTRELEPTADALLDFQAARGVRKGLSQLTGLSKTLDPTLHFLAPVQTTCNYLSTLFGNFASTGSQSDGLGTWTRFIAFTPPFGPNDEGSPASAPADGPTIFNHLHYNPYPNTDSPGQPHECEAGNEIYEPGETVIGNPPGVQSIRTEGQTKGQLEGGTR